MLAMHVIQKRDSQRGPLGGMRYQSCVAIKAACMSSADAVDVTPDAIAICPEVHGHVELGEAINATACDANIRIFRDPCSVELRRERH